MAANPGVLLSNQSKKPTVRGRKGGELARSREWHIGLRKGENVFLPHEAEVILKIPISPSLPDDSRI